MALAEFAVIERYFLRRNYHNSSIKLGIGDDCALLNIPKNQTLTISTDTLVEGVHFSSQCTAEDLGHKLLAVNLSDLASMGAKPLAVTLALTLPKIDPNWLQSFSDGFFKLADHYAIDLIGGDTTSGPLTLTAQVFGLVPRGVALRRSTASPKQLIYLTGYLGNAGLGLKATQGYQQTSVTSALHHLHRPQPRVETGLAILHYASACIDVSDGLAADLNHILQSSQVGAIIDWGKLPLATEVKAYISHTGDWTMPLIAGDDYELCFTVSPALQADLEAILGKHKLNFSLIGKIEAKRGLRLQKDGVVSDFNHKGFEHFSELK